MIAVDRRRIDSRLERIEQECADLERAAAMTFEDFVADRDLVAASERRLQIGIQAAIDVASHIIAASGLPTPEGYSQVFPALAAHSVIAAELAARLRLGAGLRNILVHDYLEVDPARLHGSLGDDTSDLRAFCGAVYAWLARAGTPAI